MGGPMTVDIGGFLNDGCGDFVLDATDLGRGANPLRARISAVPRAGRRGAVSVVLLRQAPGQLGPGAHAELAVNGRDMGLDGAHADEQLRGGSRLVAPAAIRSATRRSVAVSSVPTARPPPGAAPARFGEQRPVDPSRRPVVRPAQGVAGLPAGLASPLDLAQDQQAAGQLQAQRRGAVRRDGPLGRSAAPSRSPAGAAARASIRCASPVSAGRPAARPGRRARPRSAAHRRPADRRDILLGQRDQAAPYSWVGDQQALRARAARCSAAPPPHHRLARSRPAPGQGPDERGYGRMCPGSSGRSCRPG